MTTEETGTDVNELSITATADLLLPAQWSQVLTQLAKTRDKATFASLFHHFAPRVKAYIIRLGANPDTAEEVMQEAMLSVWRKADKFDSSKANASTWIFTLARNLCIDRMRKERYPTYELPPEEADPNQEDQGQQAVVKDRMSEQLSKLPDGQAQVIYLSYYEGLSHSEIAERLGIPLGSVKSRMRLAFEKLRSSLGESQ